jgi:uncharacterized membrane protein
MLNEWITTIIHALLCAAMVVGVLFSRTRVAQGAILATLMLLFIGIRFFHGCAMDTFEVRDDKPTLADMGMAMSIKNYKVASTYDFEQAVVGNLLIIHLIKIYVLSIYPVDTLF